MKFQMTQTYGTVDGHGHEYVTLTHSGIKAEGQPIANKTATEKEAWDAYWKAFNDFTEGAAVVEWRRPPAAEQQSSNGVWAIYSRLAIIEREPN